MTDGVVRGWRGTDEAVAVDAPSTTDQRFAELCTEPELWSVLAAASEPAGRHEIAERSGVDGVLLEAILELALLHGIVSERWSGGESRDGRTVQTTLDGGGLEVVASALADEAGGRGPAVGDGAVPRWVVIWRRLDGAE